MPERFLVYFLLFLFGFIFIVPFVWMLSTSLKGEIGLFDIPPKWIPDPVQWTNYREAVTSFPFLKFTANTVFLSVVVMFGTIASSSLVAYAFAKLRWPGKHVWFVVMLSTIMLPAHVTMIPMFLIFKELRWIDTFLPLTVPAFFGSAFNIFLLRQFFLGIPKELSEAAKIDGCSHFGIFRIIFLPLSKPALATVAILTFMGTWNDFLHPLIYLNNPDKFTLALGLRSFMMQYNTRWNVMMAASVLVMLPTVILFFMFQRYFVEGIVLTGIKG